MKKENLPLILIFISVILIFLNFLTTDYHTKGFWLRIISSILLIVAMLYTIKEQKKRE